MKLNSYEIDNQLFKKQMSLYMKIDNLINSRFNEFDPDMLSVLTRTLMDLDDKIQIYKKGLQHGEMFNVNYTRNPKERKLEGISLVRYIVPYKRKTQTDYLYLGLILWFHICYFDSIILIVRFRTSMLFNFDIKIGIICFSKPVEFTL